MLTVNVTALTHTHTHSLTHSLTHSPWWAMEDENLSLDVPSELADRDELKNPLFDVLDPVVVLIQDSLGLKRK